MSLGFGKRRPWSISGHFVGFRMATLRKASKIFIPGGDGSRATEILWVETFLFSATFTPILGSTQFLSSEFQV